MDGSHAHLDIGSPDPERPPLQANCFQQGRSINTALMPMFPYVEPGCMVPCLSLIYGGPGRDSGVFNHFNTVDEVAIVIAGHSSMRRPGDVFCGSREHVVGRFLEHQEDPEAYFMVVVTQRQAEMGTKQEEAVGIFCEECQHVLLRHQFSTSNAPRTTTPPPGYHPPLDTLVESADVLWPYNADADRRICSECGHHNPPFPMPIWGWDVYTIQTRHSERARAHLNEQFPTSAQPASKVS